MTLHHQQRKSEAKREYHMTRNEKRRSKNLTRRRRVALMFCRPIKKLRALNVMQPRKIREDKKSKKVILGTRLRVLRPRVFLAESNKKIKDEREIGERTGIRMEKRRQAKEKTLRVSFLPYLWRTKEEKNSRKNISKKTFFEGYITSLHTEASALERLRQRNGSETNSIVFFFARHKTLPIFVKSLSPTRVNRNSNHTFNVFYLLKL